ncbi:methylase [Epidermidibacterium keratini]|uniref:Methylase n=1 Tax=Epidermidibacterium keratini TaxID=1891644 RepID=A0A7L4YSD6_9ACTN|nr:methylase [Epidermidibacterium keratini]QHC01814.1 methylase [Epidermidibacterium keratini]
MTLAIDEEQLVKSRQRVKAHGEVFTPRRMVEQMLDLVREELETGPDFVDKTFLEPASGDGNFLVAILRRKLAAITKRLPAEMWPFESLFALASIYGIELLEDNHQDAKAAMLAEFHGFHLGHGTPCGPDTDLYKAAAFLVDTNIVRGDTLTGQTPEGQDIQFSWWNRVGSAPGMVERDPFTLASLHEDNLFDFTIYDSYESSRIDKVHEQKMIDA